MQASVAQPAISDEFQPWKLRAKSFINKGITSKERSDGVFVMTGTASTKTENPNNPKTMEGIPARFKMA
jgi:hypothetical protein